MRAVFREGIGCVILPPDQTLADIDSLPELTLPYPAGDPAQILWPNGDLIQNVGTHENVDIAALQAAGDWVGRTLTVYDAEGRLMPCTIIDLPFYDPDKRIPRGLDRAIP